MFSEALKKLSVEQLNDLYQQVRNELAARNSSYQIVGSVMKFMNRKTQELTFIRIKRINGTTVSGIEYDPGRRKDIPNKRWRVGKTFLMPFETDPM